MAFTQSQIDEMYVAYAQGVTTVQHGDQRVTYASLDELWAAILRMERSLVSSSSRTPYSILTHTREKA